MTHIHCNKLLRWTTRIFIKGYKKDLEVEDLYDPLEEHESGKLGDALEKYAFYSIKLKSYYPPLYYLLGTGPSRRKKAPGALMQRQVCAKPCGPHLAANIWPTDWF